MPGSTITKAYLILFVFLASSFPSFATLAKRTGKYKNWGTYRYQAQKNMMCYALTVPAEKHPENLAHGDIFFIVSGHNLHYEAKFISGYDFKPKSRAIVTINGKSFPMLTKGHSAQMEDREKEIELIAAMKSGVDMKVEAFSRRGNATSYVFSLNGVSAALHALEECESMQSPSN